LAAALAAADRNGILYCEIAYARAIFFREGSMRRSLFVCVTLGLILTTEHGIGKEADSEKIGSSGECVFALAKVDRLFSHWSYATIS